MAHSFPHSDTQDSGGAKMVKYRDNTDLGEIIDDLEQNKAISEKQISFVCAKVF
jgi:hypothetical protein